MPNHFHFLVQIRSPKTIEKRAENRGKNLFNAYTKAYNKLYDRKGSLFMSNFRRKPVSDDEYLAMLVVYIHRNPVHHGFCDSAFDWKYSSIHSYSNKNTPKTSVAISEGLKWFDDSKTHFNTLHNQLQLNDIGREFEL